MPPKPALDALLGALVALVLGLAFGRWLGPLGLMDTPSGRKHHAEPTPRTAGLALWTATLGLQALGFLHLPIQRREWLLLSGFALLGLADDLWDLRARWKALAGLALGVGLGLSQALFLRSHLDQVTLLGLPLSTSLWVTLPLLTLWFWSVPQAINLVDGANGLALGTALVIFAGMVPFWPGSGSSMALGGILVGLLLMNWPRARHFLGDCGSLYLGALLALMVMRTVALPYPTLALWLFAYPILDTTLVVTTRWRLGRPLGEADRNHFHHHWGELLPKGFDGWVAPLLWAQAALIGFRVYLSGPWSRAAWVGLALMLGQFGFFLLRRGHAQTPPPQ